MVRSALGKMADTDRFFVIAIDALSNGVSTSPSNWQGGAGEEFPAVSVADMVRSQHRLLTRYLEIDHAAAVMGISMGGMQALQWLGQYPGFVDKAVAINGSPRMTSYDLVQWQTHESAIEHLLNAGIANPEIMQFLTRLNLITLWTPRYFIANV